MTALGEMARAGVRLDDNSIARLAREEARQTRFGRVALWIGALSLLAIAVWAVAR
jgi:ubiquinone biosynthesis protein